MLKLAREGHLAPITAHPLSISNLGLLASKLKPAAHRGRRQRPTNKPRASPHAKD